MIVLDTNVISEAMRPGGNSAVLAWFDAQRDLDLFLTATAAAELWFGVERLPAGRRGNDLRAQINAVIDEDFNERVLPFDVSSASACADIMAGRMSVGRPIALADAQIAAVCWVHQARLATRNTRDFDGIGIEVINPWEQI